MNSGLSRRDMIRGSVALAAAALAHYPLSSFGFPDPETDAVLLPFTDKQAGTNGIKWENLKSWATPTPEVYVVKHYNEPKVDPTTWQLDITGLVRTSRTFKLDDIKRRRKKTLMATIECGGNGASAGFMGAVGNVRWTGTPLAPLLEECGPLKRGIEVAFFGTDSGTEEIDKQEYKQNFARSLHIADALRSDILLCYEMNGEPLTPTHGAPLRLVVPGWFGVAWVKWLKRIEVLDRRFMGKWMARKYVTLRGEERDKATVWRETSVGPIDIKSIVARAVRLKSGTIRFTGAAWSDGTPVKSVEIRLNNSEWVPAQLDSRQRSKYSWTFFSYDWMQPTPGEHTVVSRATDAEGRLQPAPEDPAIQLKKTYYESNQQWPRKLKLEA